MQNIKTETITFRVEGAGGAGGSSVGEILARAAARAGYYIACSRAFPAEIKGGRAWFQLKISPEPVAWWGGEPNLELTDARGGDWKVKVKLNGTSEPLNAKFSPLEAARSLGNPRNANIVALGFVGATLGIDREILLTAARERYARRGTVSDELEAAFSAGYQAAFNSEWPVWKVSNNPSGTRRLILNGNEAIALGALAAGVRFFAGYPITPASSILELMLRELPPMGGTALQMEDEIAALAACLGASFAGTKAMCATSGPGFALMSELLNLAVMAEVPITIVDVQRSGPATGQPSKSEQADLLYALFGSPGDVQRIVLAPSTVEEALYMSAEAVGLAEKYQMPVILLSDAALSNRIEAVPEPDWDKLRAGSRRQPDPSVDAGVFERYLSDLSGVSAMPLPGEDDRPYIASGMEHDEVGRPTGNLEMHYSMTAKRSAKLESAARMLASAESFEIAAPGVHIGLLGWGSTRGAIEAAAARLLQRGSPVATAHIRHLNPLPEAKLRAWMEPLEKVLVAEENRTGQLYRLIRHLAPEKIVAVMPVSEVCLTPEFLETVIIAHSDDRGGYASSKVVAAAEVVNG